MSTAKAGGGRRVLLATLLAAAAMQAGWAEPDLGQPLDRDEIERWSLHVFPDGTGLPPGRGTPAEGATVYRRHCQSCHGSEGRGGSAEELAGATHRLNQPDPDKTIGSYWPYATTLFDYIRRSMPLNAPAALSADQVYAVTAYLLQLNGIVRDGFVVDRETLPRIVMPNRQGFFSDPHDR